jgi:hypothetical protein
LDALPTIRWVFPIIGNSVDDLQSSHKVLRCRSLAILEQKLELQLVGETEAFADSEYIVSVDYPKQYDWIRSILELYVLNVERTSLACNLTLGVKFSPQRPLDTTITLLVSNPMNQEWKFAVQLIVDMGKPITTITMESFLRKTATAKVILPTVVRAAIPFHAYFTGSSASEFSVSAKHGILEPVMGSETEVPIDILFMPKMYGKMFKGLLVIDTIESQFIFEVIGKTPEYVPPEPKTQRGETLRKNLGSDYVRLAKPRVDHK